MNKSIAGLALAALLLGAAACSTGDAGAPDSAAAPEASDAADSADQGDSPEAAAPEDADVLVEANGSQLDIYLLTADGGRTLFGSLADTELAFEGGYQYADGAFYYIQRSGDLNADWTDELWRLEAGGQQTLLQSSPGLAFSVAPNGEYIAVTYPLSEEGFRQGLRFLDADGNALQSLPFEEVNADFSIKLEGWSSDSTLFWLAFLAGPTVQEYAQVAAPDWSVTHYDTSAITPQASETALDVDSGQVVYSDMPAFFEMVGAQQFLVSQQPVGLYLRNLSSGAEFQVASSAARAFNPAWVDGGNFAYDAPDGSGRMTYEVLSGETSLTLVEQAPLPSPSVVPEHFEGVMQPLLESEVPVMLPASFSSPSGSATYPFLIQSIDGAYHLSLGTEEGCADTGYCTYGHLRARRIGATGDAAETLMPFGEEGFDTLTQLRGFIPAYFVDYQCGANCSDATLYWIYGDYEYMLGLEAASLDDLLAVANAMVENSLPSQ